MGGKRQRLVLGGHPLLEVQNQAFLGRNTLPESFFHARQPRLKRLREFP